MFANFDDSSTISHGSVPSSEIVYNAPVKSQTPETSVETSALPGGNFSQPPAQSPRSADIPSRPSSTSVPHEFQAFDVPQRSPSPSHPGGQSLSQPSSDTLQHGFHELDGGADEYAVIPAPEGSFSRDPDSTVRGALDFSRATNDMVIPEPNFSRNSYGNIEAPTPHLEGHPPFSELLAQGDGRSGLANISRPSGTTSGVTHPPIPADPEIHSRSRSGRHRGSGVLVDTMPVLGDGERTLNVEDDIYSASSGDFPPSPRDIPDVPLNALPPSPKRPDLSTRNEESLPADAGHERLQSRQDEGISDWGVAPISFEGRELDHLANRDEDARVGDVIDSATTLPDTSARHALATADLGQTPEGSNWSHIPQSVYDHRSEDRLAGEDANRRGLKIPPNPLITPSTSEESKDRIDGEPASLAQPEDPMYKFGKLTARAPCRCACCGVVVVIIIVAVGLGVMGIDVDTDFSAFMRTDVNSSTLWDGYTTALSMRSVGRRLTTLYKTYDIHIIYELKDEYVKKGASMFDNIILSKAAKFESQLRSSPGWNEFCGITMESEQSFCRNGMSVARYAFPSVEVDSSSIIPETMTFDGGGRDQVPVETTLRVLEMEQVNLARLLLPADFDKTDWHHTRHIRSSFRFKFKCCTSGDPMTLQAKVVRGYTDKWEAFLETHALPFLREYGADGEKAKAEDLPFTIYYDGNGIGTFEVMHALSGDILLATGSMAFVLLYIITHTGSPFLGCMSMFIVIISVPVSYVVFAVLAGTTTMTVASFLSLFLVVGLGSDTIFVYTDFWRDSERLFHDDSAKRLVWTWKCAGKASLATSVTTAVSFFANLASVLKALREFGFFMGLCVVIVWILISLIYLPLCLVDDLWFRRCHLRRRAVSSKESYTAAFLDKWLETLFPHRFSMTICYGFIAMVALACAIAFVTTDTSGVTTLFPPGHNQNAGREAREYFQGVDEIFDPVFPQPIGRIEVCNPTRNNGNCYFTWCEAVSSAEATGLDKCKCARQYHNDTCGFVGGNGTDFALMTSRFVGNFDSADVLQSVVSDRIKELGGLKYTAGENFFSTRQLAPLVLQKWETGETMYKDFLQVEAMPVREISTASCGWDEICFCGSFVCHMPNYLPTIDAPVRSSEPSRRLQGLPSFKRSEIVLLFGLAVTDDAPLLGSLENEEKWSFQAGFDMSQPWAQRNIYEACTSPDKNLLVATSACWIADFRNFVKWKEERFPVPKPRFYMHLYEFIAHALTGVIASKDYLWLRDGEVKACYIPMFTNFNKDASADAALEYKKLWDDYVGKYNDEATKFTQGAWHTSKLWVRAEAQKELIMSTLVTLLIVLVLAFLGMLIFTFDVLLSFFVVIATIAVISGLAFFMICMMQWPIGPIEVIALIIFIGYAVTYSLHISHKFGAHAEKLREVDSIPPYVRNEHWKLQVRYLRTNFAIKAIGGAALGSAITTVGCSIFLICCQLTIFQKLGSVVLFISCLSILTALGPLPSTLLIAGPLNPGTSCCPCVQDMSSPQPDWLENEATSEAENKKEDSKNWEVTGSIAVAEEETTSAVVETQEHDLNLCGGASRRKTSPVSNMRPPLSTRAIAQSLTTPAPIARGRE